MGYFSYSNPLLELGQNRSKPSCMQLSVGKGNMEPEKRNKSWEAISLPWELTRLCRPVLPQPQIPSWLPTCPRSSGSATPDRAGMALSQPRKPPCKHGLGFPELVCRAQDGGYSQHRCLETEGQVSEQDLCPSGLPRDGDVPAGGL